MQEQVKKALVWGAVTLLTLVSGCMPKVVLPNMSAVKETAIVSFTANKWVSTDVEQKGALGAISAVKSLKESAGEKAVSPCLEAFTKGLSEFFKLKPIGEVIREEVYQNSGPEKSKFMATAAGLRFIKRKPETIKELARALKVSSVLFVENNYSLRMHTAIGGFGKATGCTQTKLWMYDDQGVLIWQDIVTVRSTTTLGIVGGIVASPEEIPGVLVEATNVAVEKLLARLKSKL